MVERPNGERAAAIAQVDQEVAIANEKVVKIFLDDLGLVPAGHEEIVDPWLAKMFMMCQSIGFPSISIIGSGRAVVSSARRAPRPPARPTTSMWEGT